MNYLIYDYIFLSLYTVRKRLVKTKQSVKIFLISMPSYPTFFFIKLKKKNVQQFHIEPLCITF